MATRTEPAGTFMCIPLGGDDVRSGITETVLAGLAATDVPLAVAVCCSSAALDGVSGATWYGNTEGAFGAGGIESEVLGLAGAIDALA